MGQQEVTENWRQYWIRRKDFLKVRKKASAIFEELAHVAKDFRDKRILEGGSGIGEISVDVAAEGARVYLLDISMDALVLSRRLFEDRGVLGVYLNSSIFQLPFRDAVFDVVWNAGVLEHFRYDDQVAILKEFRRVTRPDGLIIAFNPNANARLYRWGKRSAEEKGTWEFGEEYPVDSLAAQAKEAGLEVFEEYSFYFQRQLTFLKHVSPLMFRLYKAAYVLSGGRHNPFWQNRYGGYLLTSVMKKA